ncbi:alcohol dehydrogenase catalytic domain-containing protein [Catenulispora sp. NL8]|uniref:alcohol dehydrogenase n=1 Tax=Catenulispora pinistramenti TaxID=2705254 RepID=A0ABS5KI23_9ACTN|nr:alcohol dehydrogenase catalytic domain-containing protein [Catenulispora pinistramenti]MBS2545625.1 alcohol dehydrogenase catalytic domain-containing protein [Catenulispora pinistramenti]
MTSSMETVPVRYARWDGVGSPFRVVCADTPLVPGPGALLVRIDLATVCGSDLHTVGGHRPSPVPALLGHEQVGTVLGVGAGGVRCVDGTPVVPGMRVVWSVTASCGSCERCDRGLPQKCLRLRKYGHEPLVESAPLTGGFATHCVVLPGTAVVAVPADLPDEVASPASCATATVAAALAVAGPLAGRRVLVTGAGMLGLTATAMAATAGAHVEAVDPDPVRRAQALAFGAAGAHAATTAAAATAADAATNTTNITADGIREFDVALEFSGQATAVQACLDSLTVGGTAVLVGSVSPGAPASLDPERVVRGLHTVIGVHNYRPADLATAVRFLADHHRTFPFADLVGGTYELDRVDAALTAARTAAAPRQAVAPRV